MYKWSCYIDGKRVNGKLDVCFEIFFLVFIVLDDFYLIDLFLLVLIEIIWELKFVVVIEVS